MSVEEQYDEDTALAQWSQSLEEQRRIEEAGVEPPHLSTGSADDGTELVTKLAAPFDPRRVKWRLQHKKGNRGLVLAYVDARDVMGRLDKVVGPANWQALYDHVTEHGVVCRLGIRIGGEWIWKANGAGDTKVEAEKGALSDAFKRAAVLWGVARYLYRLKAQWVELDQYGNFRAPDLPDWAKPRSE